jgi:hypothetical protein
MSLSVIGKMEHTVPLHLRLAVFKICMISAPMCLSWKQNRQCTYNATLSHVGVTNFYVET